MSVALKLSRMSISFVTAVLHCTSSLLILNLKINPSIYISMHPCITLNFYSVFLASVIVSVLDISTGSLNCPNTVLCKHRNISPESVLQSLVYCQASRACLSLTVPISWPQYVYFTLVLCKYIWSRVFRCSLRIRYDHEFISFFI